MINLFLRVEDTGANPL